MVLDQLFDVFRRRNVKRVFIKHLSPNDNSKNQPYFGSNLSVLNVLPAGEVTAETSGSAKKSASSMRFKAPLNFYWVDENGTSFHAPNAQLIFYPQYPEMRFSGFLKGAEWKPSELMDPSKRGREPNRTLLLGVTNSGEIHAYLADHNTSIHETLSSYEISNTDSILDEVEWSANSSSNSEEVLLKELRRIHESGWIKGRRLTKHGGYIPCETNSNCGGYTLEAELGVSANGYSEPDFLGWEIKQYGVKNFNSKANHIITLMTPEPDGGIYADQGVLPFISKFGYPDKNGVVDRRNVGGTFKYKQVSGATGLKLDLLGYDASNKKISDPDGGIALVSANHEIAAIWSYSKLIEHWKRKHAKTAYIPSIRSVQPYKYLYGNEITLCKGTDFMLFLDAITKSKIYIDPAIKAENYSTPNCTIKRRNQIRVSFKDIPAIYHSVKKVDCTNIANS